jgi:hypothetical protein
MTDDDLSAPVRRRHTCRARGRRPLLAAGAASVALLAAGAAPAQAEYVPGAEPASATASELGDGDSRLPRISGDGRYVVFATAAPLLLGLPPRPDQYYAGGIVRKDLVSGEIALVAPPERRRRDGGAVVDAGTPGGQAGISDDGRYVLFGTTAPLAAGDRGQSSRDVYVRDMQAPLSDAGSFELVSARDGEEVGAAYRDGALGAVAGDQGLSLSDDGRTALFVTLTESDLPARPGTSTPAKQVWVRDLDRQQTRLVTRDDADPSDAGTPVPSFPEEPRRVRTPRAVLSGDGGTVVWIANSADRQTRFLPGEPVTPDQPHLLWRDLRAPRDTPARRVAGIADPDDPGCPADAVYVPDEQATGPCYGPFAQIENSNNENEESAVGDLAISDDGLRVAFTSSARRRPYAVEAARTVVYLADMTPGVSRKAGVRAAISLPRDGAGIAQQLLAGDGRTLALISRATSFPGTQPLGSFPTGTVEANNIYVLDLTANTLERATRAYTGDDYRYVGSADDIAWLSLSDDAGAIAFDVADGNLFIGDANGEKDVLVVRRAAQAAGPDGPRHQLPEPPPPPFVAEPPLQPLLPVHPEIGPLRVDRTGVARVRVWLPAAGELRAEASAPPRRAPRRRAPRGRAPRGRAPRARGRGGTSGRAAAARPVRVGSARVVARAAQSVTVRIAPSRAARRALAAVAPARLAVTLTLAYRPSAGEPTSATRRYLLRARPRR